MQESEQIRFMTREEVLQAGKRLSCKIVPGGMLAHYSRFIERITKDIDKTDTPTVREFVESREDEAGVIGGLDYDIWLLAVDLFMESLGDYSGEFSELPLFAS